MTHVLGIDTSTRVSVALAGTNSTYAHHVEGATVHVEKLMPSIQLVLAKAGASFQCVTQVVVGVGPGPFTGLRVGIATAQTLAAVLNLPLKGVCSLDVIARSAGLEGEFLVVTDARRKELYWARYVDGVRVEGPHVNAPADLPALPVVGPAADMYPLPQAPSTLVTPGVDAAVLAAHADEWADMGTEPLYLRRPDAVESAGRKSVLP